MAQCHYPKPMKPTKSERAPQVADKYVLRMPDGMRDQITSRAKANNRSMNAEIILMLQQAMNLNAGGSSAVDVEALAEALAPRLAAKLRETDL